MYNNTDMIYDDVPISSYLVVEEIERPLLANLNNNTIKVPGRNGILFSNQQMNESTIRVHLRIIEDIRQDVLVVAEELKRDLKLTDQRKLYKLKLRDYPDRFDMVKLNTSPDFDKFFNKGQITLDFINPYGTMFSDNETTVISTSFDYKGTAETYMTMKLTASGANPATIQNVSTGDVITLNGLSASDSVEIDFREETVTINSNLRMDTLNLDSDFWGVRHGVNNISLTNLTLNQITYRERWL